MKVRLTRKLAEQLDGIDVSARNEGDVFDLPRAQAQLLIAEHWAMPIDRAERRGIGPSANLRQRAVTADQSGRRRVEHHRPRLREQMDMRRFQQAEGRRAEDRIGEELREIRTRTVRNEE
jgi:hypothetical protein